MVDRELMRDHDSVTADNGFAVANDAIRLDGGKCQAIAPHGITASATGDLSAVLTAGDELGSCPFLSLGESSGVGEMAWLLSKYFTSSTRMLARIIGAVSTKPPSRRMWLPGPVIRNEVTSLAPT